MITFTAATLRDRDRRRGGTNQIGMAPGAKWIACRNMDQGVGPLPDTSSAWNFSSRLPGWGARQGDPSKAPDVTNNSWGCPLSEGCWVIRSRRPLKLRPLLELSWLSRRVIGVRPVRRYRILGRSTRRSYRVWAPSTGTDNIASFSSRGPVTVDGSSRIKPDIAAPGTSTRSASNYFR